MERRTVLFPAMLYLLGLLLVSVPVLAATLADIAAPLTPGQAWTISVQQYDMAGARVQVKSPVLWDFTVIGATQLDGVAAWQITVSRHDNGALYGMLFLRQSDRQALRWQLADLNGAPLTLDFLPSGASAAVMAEASLVPVDLPVFTQAAGKSSYTCTPVINETWGFPVTVSQIVTGSSRGLYVTLSEGIGNRLQCWENGKPWWTHAEEPGVFTADTISFTTGRATRAVAAPITRRLMPPTGRWWPMNGEAARTPWGADVKDTASRATAEASTTPWSGYWWPALDHGSANVNTFAAGGLLYKYDEYCRIANGTYPSPKARDWELANYYFPSGTSGVGWYGHCNGWAAAALLRPEPRSSVTAGGITFDVGDQKGLLSELYYDINCIFIGHRYNGDSDDPSDPTPYDFHRTLVNYIGVQRIGLVADIYRYEEVWNYPAYRYSMTTAHDQYISNRLHVICQVWYADDVVAADAVGTQVFSGNPLTYQYYITVDSNDNPVVGPSGWEGSTSNYSNPDFLWIPQGTPPSGSYRNHNTSLTVTAVNAIVGSSSPTPSIVDLVVNGSPVTGAITSGGEMNWYRFTVPSTRTYTIESWAGSLTDNIITLYGPNSQTTMIVEDDDTGTGNMAKITRTLSAGTYYLKVRAYSPSATGSYTIGVSTTSTITTLTVNGSVATGSIYPAGDADWYQFTLSSAASVTIDTTAGSLADTYMYLYGPNSSTVLIAEDDDSGTNYMARISRSLAAGTYYVKVRAYSSTATGSYSIRVTSSGSTVTALTVNGSTVTGNISPAGDYDWFQFTAAAAGTYVITTTAGSLTDNIIGLYGPNSSATFIEEDDDDGAGNMAYISRYLNPGTYYIKVQAYSSSATGTYGIRVTTGMATLTINASAVSGGINPAGDADWFRFVVSTAGTYMIDTAAGSLSDNYMFLYGPNSQTNLLEEDDDNGVGYAARIVRYLSPGTYYVKVIAYNSSSTGTYTIRVTSTSSTPGITTLMVNGASASGSIYPSGDADWYKFTVSSGGTYIIDTTAGSLTDSYMYLYGPNSQTNLLEVDDDDGTGYMSCISRTLSTGTYYVKITAFSSSSTGTYSIGVRSASSIPTLSIDGAWVSGSISTAGETDWFRFTVTATSTYVIDTSAGGLTDSVMALYGPNSQTNLQETDDDDGVDYMSRIIRTLTPGTYYVKIFGYASHDTGSYSVRVSTLIPAITVNGSAVSGSISQAGDNDWFRFTVSSSGTYTIDTTAGSLTDNVMYLYGPNSRTSLLESDDDDGVNYMARIVRYLTPGTYYLKINGYSSTATGSYTIRITH